jgi:hypothetical protein
MGRADGDVLRLHVEADIRLVLLELEYTPLGAWKDAAGQS